MTIFFIAPKENNTEESIKAELQHVNNFYTFTIDGRSYALDATIISDNKMSLIHEGKSYNVDIFQQDETFVVEFDGVKHELFVMDRAQHRKRKRQKKTKKQGDTEVKSPMPGKVVEVLVKENEDVKEGDGLLVIEAMKMENEIKAPVSGKIKKITIKAEETVDASKVLLVIE